MSFATPKSGVRELVESVYKACREDVFRHLLRLGISPGQARELCQDAFFRLFLALRNGQAIENPRKWIFTVAHHAGLNAKAATGRTETLDAAVEARLASSGPNPEQAFLEREKFDRLHRAIGGLSDQQRQCLHLRGQGFRYREIAEITGLSISTVGEYLQRAVTRLRKALDE